MMMERRMGMGIDMYNDMIIWIYSGSGLEECSTRPRQCECEFTVFGGWDMYACCGVLFVIMFSREWTRTAIVV